jgi:quercetin dioxygenase-like cupin family protein
MTEGELSAQLRREGFSRAYVWEDGPSATYPDHKHSSETAHIVLRGEITVTVDGNSNTYHAGDRCDVAANTVHSAAIGPHGCRYLIGER